jgi:Xaa-Pro dipeptidase
LETTSRRKEREVVRIASLGASMAVDCEQRVDFGRLRGERSGRVVAELERSELGGVLLFDPNNIRYVTGTQIGEWARDKNARFVLLCGGSDPILSDSGRRPVIIGTKPR